MMGSPICLELNLKHLLQPLCLLHCVLQFLIWGQIASESVGFVLRWIWVTPCSVASRIVLVCLMRLNCKFVTGFRVIQLLELAFSWIGNTLLALDGLGLRTTEFQWSLALDCRWRQTLTLNPSPAGMLQWGQALETWGTYAKSPNYADDGRAECRELRFVTQLRVYLLDQVCHIHTSIVNLYSHTMRPQKQRRGAVGGGSSRDVEESGEDLAMVSRLGDDTLLNILHRLPTRYLLSAVALVCRHWKRLCEDHLVSYASKPHNRAISWIRVWVDMKHLVVCTNCKLWFCNELLTFHLRPVSIKKNV